MGFPEERRKIFFIWEKKKSERNKLLKMVLVQRAVPPVHQVVELQVAEGCPMQKILELTAQRSMVGLLVQMVHLSAQAGDVFQSVMADASRTAQRIASLAARVEKITTEDLPLVEAFFKVKI